MRVCDLDVPKADSGCRYATTRSRDPEAQQNTRSGALITADIARKYGWHVQMRTIVIVPQSPHSRRLWSSRQVHPAAQGRESAKLLADHPTDVSENARQLGGRR